MKLSDTGELEGKITLTYTGLEAMVRRREERNEDEAERKKFLEDQVKEYIPTGSDVELTNHPDWSSSASDLTAEFNLKVPGWVSSAGRRVLFPVALFGGRRSMFSSMPTACIQFISSSRFRRWTMSPWNCLPDGR